MNNSEQNRNKVVAETPYLSLVDRDGWSHVERKNSSGVVCIAALTEDREIVLIEQYRPPVDGNVIELPAGLSGDLAEHADEAFEAAARRELLEETGFQAETMVRKIDLASSAGLTNEVVTMFLAEGLEKIALGGGDESEDITVHEVPIDSVDDWLVEQVADGKLIDARVHAGIYFLTK